MQLIYNTSVPVFLYSLLTSFDEDEEDLFRSEYCPCIHKTPPKNSTFAYNKISFYSAQ